MLTVLALVPAEAALNFKRNSVSLQHFSLSANSALLDFSLFVSAPLLCLLMPQILNNILNNCVSSQLIKLKQKHFELGDKPEKLLESRGEQAN